MSEGKKLKIIINKTEHNIGGDILNIHYVVDGDAKEKISVSASSEDLTEEERIVFNKMFMVFERLLKSDESNNIIGL